MLDVITTSPLWSPLLVLLMDFAKRCALCHINLAVLVICPKTACEVKLVQPFGKENSNRAKLPCALQTMMHSRLTNSAEFIHFRENDLDCNENRRNFIPVTAQVVLLLESTQYGGHPSVCRIFSIFNSYDISTHISRLVPICGAAFSSLSRLQ